MAELVNLVPDPEIRAIAQKIVEGIRIAPGEGLMLYNKADLPSLALMAGIVRRRKNGNYAFFVRNFHIEPTNKCIYNCRFCSYHKKDGDPESWEHSHDEIMDIIKGFDDRPVSEIHIVGGVHPHHDLHYYGALLSRIKKHRPSVHIKAFSAIELEHMILKTGVSITEGLKMLKEYGLDSIPGGGAEIFDEKIRAKICPEKTGSSKWLSIHETAHRTGLSSNATMLYGHIEKYPHRIDHMERIRTLQDKTGGFNAFIPLKYKKENNPMSGTGETTIIDDLRNYAVSRIYLDNINHIKAYWPMMGKESAGLSLLFGTDDLDGTIDDTTKIYSMAGSGEKNPVMTADEVLKLIRDASFTPVERDSLYNFINIFAL